MNKKKYILEILNEKKEVIKTLYFDHWQERAIYLAWTR